MSHRCWSVACSGCRKTYRIIAAEIVDDILTAHQDLRTLWWLAVPRIARDELPTYWRRLYKRLEYHNRRPEKYIWFVTATEDEAVRYTITNRAVDTNFLDRYWTRYGGLPVDVLDRDREQLVRDVASHCGEVNPPFEGRRMGSSRSLPGVSPRRHSSGRTTPQSPEVVYSQWVDDVPAD